MLVSFYHDFQQPITIKSKPVPTIEIKYKIIKELENDESSIKLRRIYDISRFSIIDIKRQTYDIENYMQHVDVADYYLQ